MGSCAKLARPAHFYIISLLTALLDGARHAAVARLEHHFGGYKHVRAKQKLSPPERKQQKNKSARNLPNQVWSNIFIHPLISCVLAVEYRHRHKYVIVRGSPVPAGGEVMIPKLRLTQ